MSITPSLRKNRYKVPLLIQRIVLRNEGMVE